MPLRNPAHAAILGFLLSATVLAAVPANDSPPGKEDQAIQAQLDRALPTVQLNQVPFSEAIDFLHDITKINFVVDWKALKSSGVDQSTPLLASLHDVRVSALLKVILDQASGDGTLGYAIDHGAVKISTRSDLGKALATTRPAAPGKQEQALQAALDHTVPSVNFSEISLSDALDFLRDLTGTNVMVNWKAMKTVGIDQSTTLTESLRNVKLSKVLKVTLDQAGNGKLDYSIDQNIITISIRNDSDKPAPTTRPAADKENKAALAALDHILPSVEFNQIPTSDALDFLRDITQANIVVNWKVLEAAGIDKKTATVTAELKSVKLSAILKIVLDQAGDGKLDYVVDEGVITVCVKDPKPASDGK